MSQAADIDALDQLATVCEDGVRWCEKAREKCDVAEMSALLGSLQQEHAEAAETMIRLSTGMGGHATPEGSIGGAVGRLAFDVKTRFADDEESVMLEQLARIRERTLATFDEKLDHSLSPATRETIAAERERLERGYAPLELHLNRAGDA